MNTTNKDTIRSNIARTLSDLIPESTASLIEIAAATGLTTRCIAHTQIHGIIDFADLISLCRALKFDPAKLIPDADDKTPKWQNPKRVKPAEDLYVFFRLSSDTEQDPKRIGLYDAAGYICEKDGQNYQWYHVTSWREIAEHELTVLNNEPVA